VSIFPKASKISVLILLEQRFYFLVSFILILLCNKSFAQPWEHTYGGIGQHAGYNIIENYDHGFCILGDAGSTNAKIQLIKTDVDGNMLWTKNIGTPGYFSSATGIDNTLDGGLILGGVTSQYDSMGAAFALKLDACGNKQWCKIFSLAGDYDFLSDVYQLSDSHYIALTNLFGPNSSNNQRVGLMKLDTLGNTIWYRDFSHYDNPTAWSLLLSGDNGFVVSGQWYIPNPGDTTYYWSRTMVIKVDSAGNEQWNIPYGAANYFVSRGAGARETIDGGFLVLCTQRDTINANKDWTYLFKTNLNGNVQWSKQIGDTAKAIWDLDIVALNDSQSAILSVISDTSSTNVFNLKVLKIDTAGTILDSVTYGYNSYSPLGRIKKTSDNKILVCSTKYLGSNNHDIYVLKLNENLQLDTMYNISLNYDSLCSTGIPTGTITLDTMSYVGVEETIKEAETFTVYPNPSFGKFNVSYPLFKNGAVIEIYDLLGEKIHWQKIHSPQTEMDLSNHPDGIYLCVIRNNSGILDKKKLIILNHK
jgi:Secretion system C-terminal sorting domain